MKLFRYLALGDSYTIGESVSEKESFPHQLKARLEETGQLSCSEIRVVAKTGWTTEELQQGIRRAKLSSEYDLVSLLIGVNNQYRRYDREKFTTGFQELLRQAIGFAGGKMASVFVVAIPDYGCTPFGAEMAQTIFQDLTWYNSEAARLCLRNGIRFVDTFPSSRKALTEPDLIAKDRLHPSGKMYRLWVDQIFPVAREILTAEKGQG